MRTAFRTLLLAGAASLAVSGALAQQVTLDGIPANKLGNYKITCTDRDNAAGQPCFVSLSSGGQAVSNTNRLPANVDGSTVTANQGAAGSSEWLVKDGADGPGTNPGAGARGWLSGIYAKQAAAVATGTNSPTAQPVQGAGPTGVPVNTSGGQYNATLPTLATGAYGPLAVDSSGRLIQAPGFATQTGQDTGNGSLASIATTSNATSNNTSGINTKLAGTLTTANTVASGAGGLTTLSRIASSAATTNNTLAKATPGRVYKITGYNAAASIRWLHLYNSASIPTPGVTAVFFSLPLPPGAYSFDAADIGYFFSTGIAYSITTGAADSDTTAVAAGDILNQNVWVQ